MKSIKVTLDGVGYDVPKFNCAQQREVTRLFDSAAPDIGFDILALAFSRATPKVDVNTLEPDFEEIGAAVQAILAFSGLKKKDPSPPAA
jgi:hypothetical protein